MYYPMRWFGFKDSVLALPLAEIIQYLTIILKWVMSTYFQY